jgi:hypothetical protein
MGAAFPQNLARKGSFSTYPLGKFLKHSPPRLIPHSAILVKKLAADPFIKPQSSKGLLFFGVIIYRFLVRSFHLFQEIFSTSMPFCLSSSNT